MPSGLRRHRAPLVRMLRLKERVHIDLQRPCADVVQGHGARGVDAGAARALACRIT